MPCVFTDDARQLLISGLLARRRRDDLENAGDRLDALLTRLNNPE